MIRVPNRPPDLEATVFGEAKTKGSTRSFVPRRRDGSIITRPGGAPVVVTKNDAGEAAEAWAGSVAAAVGREIVETGFVTAAARVPVVVELVFFRPRPASHHGSGRNAGMLRDAAPALPAVKPDVDKLTRCVLDALKGVAWHDDGQVVGAPAWKAWGAPARLELRLWVLPATVGELASPTAQLADSR